MKTKLHTILAIFGAVCLMGQEPAPGVPGTKPSPKGELSQEDVVAARAVPYRPSLTRDPFDSPTDLDITGKADLVEDVAIKGVVKMGGKLLAVVSDSRGNVRWLPVGFRFKDGQISSIDDKSVTFHQWDVNSTVHTSYRTVIKSFKREEGKR